MAKINKYWGMVALGAVTAAAAGAIAATFAKRRALEEAADLEEDFEDEQETNEQPEEKEVREDFVSWEATSEEAEAEAGGGMNPVRLHGAAIRANGVVTNEV